MAILQLPWCQWSNWNIWMNGLHEFTRDTYYNYKKLKHNRTIYIFYGMYCVSVKWIMTALDNGWWPVQSDGKNITCIQISSYLRYFNMSEQYQDLQYMLLSIHYQFIWYTYNQHFCQGVYKCSNTYWHQMISSYVSNLSEIITFY